MSKRNLSLLLILGTTQPTEKNGAVFRPVVAFFHPQEHKANILNKNLIDSLCRWDYFLHNNTSTKKGISS